MNEEKLIEYIKGQITSEAETIEILDWIESSPENQEQYNRLKNLWVVTGLSHPESVEIPAFSFPADEDRQSRERMLIQWMRYAAVFVLAFALGTLSLYLVNRNQQSGYSSLYNTIEVPNGERSQILLYDGTKVWLNSGTKFRYPVAFSRTTRDVYLEGEAFFDVAKDASHPFVVNAGQLKVNVLGTRFNVCAYPEDNEFFTTLEEGSVNAVNAASGTSIILKPGEQLILDRGTNELKRWNVNTELYTSWKENLLRFDDAPFGDVIKKMERWYDVKIKVDPSINAGERYTMTIKTESLREMLNLLSKTTQMTYDIKENNVLIKRP